MGLHCAIIPAVKDKTGEIKDSKLFKDLLDHTNNNREKTKDIYYRVTNEKFVSDNYNQLKFDDLGEVTLDSLIKNTNILDFIGKEEVSRNINKDLNYLNDKGEINWKKETDANNQSALTRAIDFNRNNPYRSDYVALVEYRKNPETGVDEVVNTVNKRTSDNVKLAEQLETNFNLNNKLKGILEEIGISVGVLNSLDRSLRVDGVTDFSSAQRTADGLIELIRIAEGHRGEQALPEEFAHATLQALGNHPLVLRLKNSIEQGNLLNEILGEDYLKYHQLYKGNQDKLLEEAAGKLVAKHLLEGAPIEVKPYRNLLQRIIDAIKGLFGKLSIKEINKAKILADVTASELAKRLTNDSLLEDMSLDNISTKESFYSTSEEVNRGKKLLKKIIDTEITRFKIYSNRANKQAKQQATKEGKEESAFTKKQRESIQDLQKKLDQNLEMDGVFQFMENALETLSKVSARIIQVMEEGSSLNIKARALRDARNYIYSYKNLAKIIREAMLEDSSYEDNQFTEAAKANLDSIDGLVNDLLIQYEKNAMPLFKEFLKEFIGDVIEVPFGKWKGKKMTVDELMVKAENDISLFDLWLDSAADSKNFVIKAFDQANKKHKANARERTIRLSKDIAKLHMEAENSGVTNFEFMFERWDNGDKTGNYISPHNIAKYYSEFKKFKDGLVEKYGENREGKSAYDYNREMRQWHKENSREIEVNGVKEKVPGDKYINKAYNELTPAQKRYLDGFTSIKQQLDQLIPPNYTRPESAIKIRKDLVERALDSKSIKEVGYHAAESIKNLFLRRGDDVEFSERATLRDFENREVQTLPVYYTKMREGESMNDITDDTTSSLIAYADMAINYDEMSKVIDIAELSRDLSREIDVQKRQGNKALTSTITGFGETVSQKIFNKGDATNFMKRLDTLFDMQYYSGYMKDEGTFGDTRIDKAKSAGFINMITSLGGLALNSLAGLANITVGKVMMRVEAISGEFFGYKNLVNSDKIYTSNIAEFLGELGNRIRISKLALWNEKFDVMQEYETDIKNTNFDRKTWFSRMFNMSSLFFINNSGEHWMQTRTSLALADATKVKLNGKEISLWDAMEVVYLDSSNPSLGATLEVKKGVTKLDGSSLTKEDLRKFERKTKGLNNRMHGIYNQNDKSMIQHYALGRMAMLFRRWMRPGWIRRFQAATENQDLGQWTEGYYNTVWNFMKTLVTDLRNSELSIATRWEQLHNHQKKNLIRATSEVGHFLGILLALFMYNKYVDDDKPASEKSWAERMFEYQLYRSKTEVGVFIPGYTMLNEGLKMVQSPAAGINTIESFVGLIRLFNPNNYEFYAGDDAVVKQGRHKGRSKAQKYIVDSPLSLFYKTIEKGMHPEGSVPFYKQ